jgi:hypothetical protein
MPPPLIRRTVDVMLGDPHVLADRVERVFAEQEIAAVCRVEGTFVHIDVSTLDLAGDNLEESIESWITQAATDVAASVRWAQRS